MDYEHLTKHDREYEETARLHDLALDDLRRTCYSAGVEAAVQAAERGAILLRATPETKRIREARRYLTRFLWLARLEAGGLRRLLREGPHRRMPHGWNFDVVSANLHAECDGDEELTRVEVSGYWAGTSPRNKARLLYFANRITGDPHRLEGHQLQIVGVDEPQEGPYECELGSGQDLIVLHRDLAEQEFLPLGLYGSCSPTAKLGPREPDEAVVNLRVAAPALLCAPIVETFLPAWLSTGAGAPCRVAISAEGEGSLMVDVDVRGAGRCQDLLGVAPAPRLPIAPARWLAELGTRFGEEWVAMYKEAGE